MNKLFSSFYNKYYTIVNKHAPVKKLPNCKVKQLSKPWITNGIKVAIKVKNIYYMHLEMKLGTYRNKICTLIRLSERRYYDTFLENNMVNMKNPGKGINELLHQREKT